MRSPSPRDEGQALGSSSVMIWDPRDYSPELFDANCRNHANSRARDILYLPRFPPSSSPRSYVRGAVTRSSSAARLVAAVQPGAFLRPCLVPHVGHCRIDRQFGAWAQLK
jgi:hypothetical protein